MKIVQLPVSQLIILLILARFQSPATGNLKVRGWKPGAQLSTWRVDSAIAPELENSSRVSAHSYRVPCSRPCTRAPAVELLKYPTVQYVRAGGPGHRNWKAMMCGQPCDSHSSALSEIRSIAQAWMMLIFHQI